MSTTDLPAKTLDADALAFEAVRHLRALLRLDTTNPPGNEYLAATYLRDQLAVEGVATELIEPTPGRVSIHARLPGTGTRRPLLLVSHTDVVPVERDRWSVDPFSGEERDGFIYGRGAVDMKQMTAIQLTLLLHWARRARADGHQFARDISMLAVADEEQSGRHGMQWIVANRPDLVDVEFALNEGGGFGNRFGQATIYPCEGAQKGSAQVTLRATGKPGHAAFPHSDTAVVRLGRALVQLGRAPLPLHVIPTTRRFIETLAGQLGPVRGTALRQLLNPQRNRWAARQIPDADIANALQAMLHNTASPTILQAGQALNVIPSEAIARIDLRTIPGQSPDDLAAELRRRIPDPQVAIEIDAQSGGYELPFETPLFAAIQAAIAQHDPGARVAPYLFPAVSDSRYLAPRGVIAYGFIPHRAEPGVPAVQSLAHGHDERVSVANVGFGLRVLQDAITILCR